MLNEAQKNTDREIWREPPGDYYSDSIHVTENGGIGFNCGGAVIVMPLRNWFAIAKHHIGLIGKLESELKISNQ